MTKQEFIDKNCNPKSAAERLLIIADLEKVIAWENSIWKRAAENLYNAPLKKGHDINPMNRKFKNKPNKQG